MAMDARWATPTIPMTTTIDAAHARLTLLQWLSPAFPISAFAYSHGLETVIADGRISDRDSLADWLRALLIHGSGRTDGVLMALALRDAVPLPELGDMARALAASRERWEETRDMGRAFLRTTEALGASPSGDLPYPVAFGLRARALGLPVTEVLAAYLHGFVANLVAVGVRFVPLGQSEGQAVLAEISADIAALSAELANADPDAIGSATFAADLAAMEHETLDVRLFKT